MNQYEGMFLFDPTFGSSFENCETEIRRLLDRASGEILFCRKWDERRLAYKINGRKRGVYALTYFKAPADRIAPLERDAQLSEHILRLLVLRADGLTQDDMEGVVSSKSDESAPRTGDGAEKAAREKPAPEKPVPEKPAPEKPAPEAAAVKVASAPAPAAANGDAAEPPDKV